MTDRYARIREALAMGPTQGPWVPKELPRDMQRDGYKFSISRGGLGWWIAKVTHEANGGSGAANAALIAACNPNTIRALLAERDALREALTAIANTKSRPGDEKAEMLLASAINVASAALAQEQGGSDAPAT